MQTELSPVVFIRLDIAWIAALLRDAAGSEVVATLLRGRSKERTRALFRGGENAAGVFLEDSGGFIMEFS